MLISPDEIDGINLSLETERISKLLSFADLREFESIEALENIAECVYSLNRMSLAIGRAVKDKLETVRIKS